MGRKAAAKRALTAKIQKAARDAHFKRIRMGAIHRRNAAIRAAKKKAAALLVSSRAKAQISKLTTAIVPKRNSEENRALKQLSKKQQKSISIRIMNSPNTKIDFS